ncbi:DUF1292 domain-containing protein [Clostridium fallax]|uniref:DUF1292 domain-containing protein n=1 Tax=Clostridium fallax TaxID=1533 RepID=A0A1M4U888_9CLOT|nr:DUF1292 domain-containing protein [Clostridium fallax]SHE52884.1 Protein of unknown function [Clostridium fallax]SQB06126.1 Uncharacterised protein [Clostridium fallax]
MNKIMSFIDENGKRIEYEILEELIVNKAGYMIMRPKDNKNDISIYKLIIKKSGEELDLVEDSKVIDLVKSNSKVLSA